MFTLIDILLVANLDFHIVVLVHAVSRVFMLLLLVLGIVAAL